MSDQMTQEIKDIVDGIFKQQEESIMRKETEDALRNSKNMINELNESLEAKDSELTGIKEEISNFNDTVTELNDKIGELKESIKTLEQEKSDFESREADIVKRAEKAEEDLEDIKKDQLAKARFGDLKEAGIASSNEEDQTAKVREMSDEEFSAYRDELLVIRESIIAELNESDPIDVSTTETEEDAAGTEGNAAGESDGEVAESDEDDAAGSEDPINPMHATAAALNMEIMPGKDVMAKYKELGNQMAANITGDNN
jgi:chromosome segregation ATPase